jgi:hypothetical protein
VTIGSIYVETAMADGTGQCAVAPGSNLAGADVQAWNGSAWVTTQSFSGQSGDIQLTFNPPISTSKLRLFNVTTSNGNGNALVWEWHVFSGQGCIPPPD